MKKILIAVPCMDMVQARFAKSLATLAKVEDCTVSFIMNSLIYDARNKFCQQAIEGEFDYIMWFDSDMVFPPETLQKLLLHDKDIVSGLYFRRSFPFTPVAFEKLDLTDDNGCDFKDLADVPKELAEVAGVGFGCVLMKTDVLFDIAGKEGPVWFSPIGNIGEDCAFCIRARKYGYSIWLDPTLKLGHVGTTVITENVYKKIK